MYRIDVTITACCRDDILYSTLHSFCHNFLGWADARCVINIDPLGYSTPDQVLDVCNEFFNDVVYRVAEQPNFARAFKWCWDHAEADYVFHLEDDWLMLRDVDINVIFNLLEKYENLALLRLPAFVSGETQMKNWNKFFPYNGEFYECPAEMRTGLGFCGHPSLIKMRFVDRVRCHLRSDYNPEKIFHARGGEIHNEILRWRYGVYGKPGWRPVIRDIGRRWMIENNYRKSGSKAFFLKWEKVDA